MASKTKHAEVASARFRLGATLQHLVEKKEDSATASDGEEISLQPDLGSSLSPIQSPRKMSKIRKRKRKEDTTEYLSGTQHQTYVMKLFDRSVDMAQFDENSPLYPICRAWIRNQPNARNTIVQPRTPTPEPEPGVTQDEDARVHKEFELHSKRMAEVGPKIHLLLIGGHCSWKVDYEGIDSYPDIYSLPPPIKEEFGGHGEIINLRIPPPLHQPQEKLDVHQDPERAPPPEQLLLDHMMRWKRIRNLWREAGIVNEMRYAGSLLVLKDMFERNTKDG